MKSEVLGSIGTYTIRVLDDGRLRISDVGGGYYTFSVEEAVKIATLFMEGCALVTSQYAQAMSTLPAAIKKYKKAAETTVEVLDRFEQVMKDNDQ
jgi:putative aminopeptidase FrvX